MVKDFSDALEKVQNSDQNFYYSSDKKEISKLIELCKYPYYILDYKVLFVAPQGDIKKHYYRLKNNNKFNIDDAIKYKN